MRVSMAVVCRVRDYGHGHGAGVPLALLHAWPREGCSLAAQHVHPKLTDTRVRIERRLQS